MKERKFKQFVNVFGDVILRIVWLLLTAFSIFMLTVDSVSMWIRLSLLAVSVVYTIIYIIILDRKRKKQEFQAKEHRLQKLKNQYSDYISMVDKETQEILHNFSKELIDELELVIDTKHDYLISFENKLDWICENRITGKPDSFIIATCLMYSLIEHPRITKTIRYDLPEVENMVFSMNLNIAINCAFEIISEPSTYYEDDNGKWVEEKHPKADIVVPDGLIKDSRLHNRIINAIYRDYENKRTSIMQFSNLLHLIYLNSR